MIRFFYLLLIIAIPLSVSSKVGPLRLELPTEPLMILLVVLTFPHLWQKKDQVKTLWKSPLWKVSLFGLLWMVVTILTSSDPVVSTKYAIVALTHWYLFMSLPLILLDQPMSRYVEWFRLYVMPLLGILFYAWYHHSQYQFSVDTSVLVARPFYFDHALLSTAILLVLPIECLRLTQKNNPKWLVGILVMLLVLGVYLSYSRAAWLSAFIALIGVLFVLLLKHSPRVFIGVSISGIVLLALTFSSISQSISANRVESKKGSWWQQIASITNIQTDVSNLERLNRYKCAIRMTRDRPIMGFGAGTFQVAYLPYQRPEEMTRISVTHAGPHPPGRGGGAHSEYLQAFSEGGLLGGLLFLALAFTAIWTAVRIYLKSTIQDNQRLALALLFGLLTFFIHGLFNNFLHQSKIAILIWMSMAILVILDRKTTASQSA